MRRIVLALGICLLTLRFCYADEIQLRPVLSDDKTGEAAFDLLEVDKYEKLRVGKDVLLTISKNSDVDRVEIGWTKYDLPRLQVYLSDAGKKKFLNLKKNYSGQRVAIVFNNYILTAPYIKKSMKDGVILIQNDHLLGTEAEYNMLIKSIGFSSGKGVDVGSLRSPLFKGEEKEDLLDAVRAEKPEEVRKLVEKGADVNIKDNNRWTVLMLAVYRNDRELVEYLISKGADVNAHNNYGRTALMLLAEKYDADNTALAKILLSGGAEVDLRDEGGRTAFMLSVGEGNYRMAEFLLLHGASVDVKDISGDNVLIYYASNYSAMADGKLVDFLVLKGIDINAQNNLGKTALMMAAKRGNDKLVKYLCEKGADVDIKDKNDMTALMWAASHEDDQIVEYLRSRGKSSE